MLEDSRDAGLVQDSVAPYVERLCLAHPLRARAIASARAKTDAIDALTLAPLLQADLIPRAHLRTPESRER